MWMLRLPGKDVKSVIHIGATQIDGVPALSVAVDAYKDDESGGARYGLPRAIIIGRVSKGAPERMKDLLESARDQAGRLSDRAFKRIGDLDGSPS